MNMTKYIQSNITKADAMYMTADMSHINLKLRENQVLTEEDLAIIEKKDNITQSCLTMRPIIAYRMMPFHGIASSCVCHVYTDKGFLEGSLNYHIEEEICENTKLIFYVPSGIHCAYCGELSDREEEDSIIFPRGSRFRIIKVIKSPFEKTTIQYVVFAVMLKS